MMDVAVPANLQAGPAHRRNRCQGLVGDGGGSVGRDSARRGPILVDLRERGEREKRGLIPGSVHAPYGDTEENVGPAAYCTSWRGAVIAPGLLLRVRRALGDGARDGAGGGASRTRAHLKGGIEAWRQAGGEIELHCY